MITLANLKYELQIDPTDTSQDDNLSTILERSQNYIKGYINQDDFDFTTNPALDEVVLYIALRSSQPETRNRAGLSGMTAGMGLTYEQDLPAEYQRLLKRYRKVMFT